MSTNNFYYRNTPRCYVVLNIETDDNWVWDDEKAMLREGLINKLEELTKGTDIQVSNNEPDTKHDLRSYPTQGLCSIRRGRYFAGVYIEITINCFVRGGYYQAACLDWEQEFGSYGSEEADDYIEEIANEIEGNHSKGLAGMLKNRINIWLDNQREELVRLVNEAFEVLVLQVMAKRSMKK